MGLLSWLFDGGNIGLIARSIGTHHKRLGNFDDVLMHVYYADFKRRLDASHGTKTQQAVRMIEGGEIRNYRDLAILALMVDAAPSHYAFRDVAQDFSKDLTKYLAGNGIDTIHISGNVLRRSTHGASLTKSLETHLSAQEEDADAQFRLGLKFKNDEVLRDYAKALVWLRAAADQGHADAQLHLGLMYSTPLGVPKDDAAASIWFIKAAEQGSTDAQDFMGMRYLGGDGVKQGFVQGLKWLSIAETWRTTRHEDDASLAELREWAVAKMTRQQIDEAQRLAREWNEAFERRKT